MNSRWQKRYKTLSDGRSPNHLLLRIVRSQGNTICKATNTIYVIYSDGMFSYKNAREQRINFRNKPLIATALESDVKKGVWVANTEGILFYIVENKAVPVDTFEADIRYIRQHDSLLFLGTGKGLIRYNVNTKEKEYINTLDGLPSNIITGLGIARDTVFAATLKGLAKIPVAYNYKNTVPPEINLKKVMVKRKK